MATRPVFLPKTTEPYVAEVNCEFKWNGGFALSQKRKNIAALHEAFLRVQPDKKLLEISTKSENPLGVALSAHNLMLYVPSLDRKVSVECVYHGSKVFTGGGPYTEIYDLPPAKAKKYLQEVSQGEVCSFQFEGESYHLFSNTAFYDWLYFNALLENRDLIEQLLKYDAFTDIAYTPGKSLACQARTVAMFVSLYELNSVDKFNDFNEFKNLTTFTQYDNINTLYQREKSSYE